MEDKKPLLENAIKLGKLKECRQLLESGCDPNAKNKEGETMLHLAVFYNEIAIVHLLLKHGANIDAVTEKSGTAIQLAIKYKRMQCLRVLLNNGASVYTLFGAENTSSHLEDVAGQIKIVETLILMGMERGTKPPTIAFEKEQRDILNNIHHFQNIFKLILE